MAVDHGALPTDPLSQEEAMSIVSRLQLLASCLVDLPLDRLVSDLQNFDAVGPIMDPTAWQRTTDRTGRFNRDLAVIFSDAQRKVKTAVAEWRP